MAHKILKKTDRLLYLSLTGMMEVADREAIQDMGREMIEKTGKARMLVVFDNFQGWERSPKWNDVSFLSAYGDDVEKIAIVGDEHWRDEAYLFTGKGLRMTEIEFFPHSALHVAEEWVRE